MNIPWLKHDFCWSYYFKTDDWPGICIHYSLTCKFSLQSLFETFCDIHRHRFYRNTAFSSQLTHLSRKAETLTQRLALLQDKLTPHTYWTMHNLSINNTALTFRHPTLRSSSSGIKKYQHLKKLLILIQRVKTNIRTPVTLVSEDLIMPKPLQCNPVTWLSYFPEGFYIDNPYDFGDLDSLQIRPTDSKTYKPLNLG